MVTEAGDGRGVERWREAWMGPVLELLAGSDEHLRNNVSIYSIPMLLRLDTSSLAPLLRRALEPLQGQLAAAQVGQVLSTPLPLPVSISTLLGEETGSAWCLHVSRPTAYGSGSCIALPVADSRCPAILVCTVLTT